MSSLYSCESKERKGGKGQLRWAACAGASCHPAHLLHHRHSDCASARHSSQRLPERLPLLFLLPWIQRCSPLSGTKKHAASASPRDARRSRQPAHLHVGHTNEELAVLRLLNQRKDLPHRQRDDARLPLGAAHGVRPAAA